VFGEKKESSGLRKLTYMAVIVTGSDQEKGKEFTEVGNCFSGMINTKQSEPHHVPPLIYYLAVKPVNFQFRATT
jgi:hypothetical protein